MNNSNSLFPQTTPINFGNAHAKVLSLLLDYSSIEQREIRKITKINKTTLSQCIDDLIKLKWCFPKLGQIKIISIRKERIKEIYLFLDGWKIYGKAILIRPHNINISGLIFYAEGELEKVIRSLVGMDLVRYRPTKIKNNVEHIFSTEYGKVTLFEGSNKFNLFLEDFILPLPKEHLPYLEQYIRQGIYERFNSIMGLLNLAIRDKMVEIKEIFCLKKIELGVIVKEDIHKMEKVKAILKENNLIADKSIYGQTELEAKGELGIIVEDVKNGLQEMIDANISLRD